MALWRGLIAASGLTGSGLAIAHFGGGLGALSQQASIATGVVYAGLAVAALARSDVDWAWGRGALATILALVTLTYALLLEPDYRPLYSLLEHLITPALVTIDYVLVGHSGSARAWWPPSWLVPLLAYLVFYLASDLRIYGFLESGSDGLPGLIAGFAAAVLALGYALTAARTSFRRRLSSLG